jgi:hypothetical protein
LCTSKIKAFPGWRERLCVNVFGLYIVDRKTKSFLLHAVIASRGFELV